MKWKSLEEAGFGTAEYEKPLFPQFTDKELGIGKYLRKRNRISTEELNKIKEYQEKGIRPIETSRILNIGYDTIRRYYKE